MESYRQVILEFMKNYYEGLLHDKVKNFDMIVARQHCIPCKREFKDLDKKKCEHCLWRDSEYITRLGKGGK